MENTKVGSGKQTAAHGQESKKSSGYKRNNNNNKKNYSRQKNQKKNNNSAKAKTDINKNFDELERKLEAKLESSLGLTPASGSKKNNIRKPDPKKNEQKIKNNFNPQNRKNQNKKNGGKNSAKSSDLGKKTAENKRENRTPAEIVKEALNGKNNNAGKNANKNNINSNINGNAKNTISENAAASGPKAFSEGGFFNFSKLKFGKKNKENKNQSKNAKGIVKDEKISIIPLGGLGEIGKNMTAIKYGNHILVVDGGMSFPDDDLPGIDLVIPDYNYLLENRSMVEAFVVTHGHEDHIGGLPYVLNDLPVPVFGGKLTIGLIKGKLEEHNVNGIRLNEVRNRDVVEVGPFKVEFIRVSHSIPDSFALAIHTPAGIIVHTGDFKLDMSPVDNQFMDLARFSELGEQGVLLMLADSTNVERPGFTASEKVVGQTLETTFLGATGRIIVTSFASNVHRIQQVIWAAEATNRKVSVVGRGMTNVMAIAMDLGYLQLKPDTLVDISQINSYPDNKVTILTTGSQGESFAGLTRMSQGEHKQIKIRQGDLIVISANAIPGNEKTVAKTIDNLYRRGADVMYGRGLGIHVSGHASIEDLKLIFNMVKPKFFMPVHGEYRMLCAHGKLAEKMGVEPENIFLLENGQVLDITASQGKINGKVHSGRILIDGLGVGDIGTAVLKERRQLSNDGIVIANIVMDKKNGRTVADPYLVSRGFVYERDNDLIISEAEQIVQNICDDYLGKNYNLPNMKNHLRSALAKYFYEQTGRKPIVLPIIMEV